MNWPKLKSISVLAVVALFFISSPVLAGTVPNALNYQGTLYDSNGQPVTASKEIRVSLYDVAAGGTAFWTETQAGIIVKSGNFSLVLGKDSSNPIDQAKLSGTTYIGIKVGTDAEMLPRQQFTSVAYALKSGDGVPIGAIIMWSGTAIPAGWALCDGTNGTPNLRDRFIVGAGPNYAVGAGKNSGTEYTINFQHSHLTNDHTHVVAMDAQGSHQHTGTTGNNSAAKQRRDDSATIWSAAEPHTHAFTTDPAGLHAHNAWSGGASDRNTDSRLSTAQDIRPPYYALAFIMKLQ